VYEAHKPVNVHSERLRAGKVADPEWWTYKSLRDLSLSQSRSDPIPTSRVLELW
jgi:hypothetical protein